MTSHILYVTMKEPPRKGSLQEIVLHRYIIDMDYRKTEELKILMDGIILATSQDRKKAMDLLDEAWKGFLSGRYPWLEKKKEEEAAQVKEVFEEMQKEGPFRIVSVAPNKNIPKLRTITSKLAGKIHDPQRHLRQLGTNMSRLQQSSGDRAGRTGRNLQVPGVRT